MNVLCAVITLMLLALYPQPDGSHAALESDNVPLQIRASDHPGFLRIVLEGPDDLISKGKVSQKGHEIMVNFPGPAFAVKQQKLPVSYRKNNDALIFALKNSSDLKIFSLDSPSRLVIDAYPKADTKTVNATEKNNPPLKKVGNTPLNPLLKAPTVGLNRGDKSSPLKKGEAGGFSNRIITTSAGRKLKTLPYEGDGDFSNKLSEQYIDTKTEVTASDKTTYDYNFIPEKYKKVWSVLKAENNPFKVIAELSANKPNDADSLGIYHFIYGEALDGAKKYLEAIEQLRLAYVYSTNTELKELAFIRRAEIYQKTGLVYEAKTNYSIFIKDFPSSKYIAKAHLGFANSLSATGEFSEAVRHYENAGRGADVLFSMANALQRSGKVEEAGKAYHNATLVDSSYPGKSPETYYLIGENMRTAGRITEAKRHMSGINTGPFRDNAIISLGLIAMEEADYPRAIEYFKSGAFSKDRKIKEEALLNLSLTYLKANNLKESISSLEEIRHSHFDSSGRYKETLILLAKLYRKEGRGKESVSLLKEVVYGKEPPAEAFAELETLLLEAGERTTGELSLADLWKEVGQWMLDPSREEFLLKIANKLKPHGGPFLKLCSWLVENTSGKARTTAALELADYYVGLGNMPAAERYITVFKDSKAKDAGDAVQRIEARINYSNKRLDPALKNLMAIKEFESSDLKLLGKIINAVKETAPDNTQKVVAFYEKMINKFDGDAEDYIMLADYHYDKERDDRALSYYGTAHEKDPDDEWAMYRLGSISDTDGKNEMLDKLQKGDSLISRLAKTKLRGLSIINKIDEVYQ
ncbi:MAG: hypothetical protein HY808_05705 [Nitrospirae bacterium]|nr:hypothetical protein [Nitrospirota bacterium]